MLDRFMAERINRKLDVSDKLVVLPPWPAEDPDVVVSHEDNPFRILRRPRRKTSSLSETSSLRLIRSAMNLSSTMTSLARLRINRFSQSNSLTKDVATDVSQRNALIGIHVHYPYFRGTPWTFNHQRQSRQLVVTCDDYCLDAANECTAHDRLQTTESRRAFS